MIHTEHRSHDSIHNPWMRGLIMFGFLIFFGVAEALLALVAILQFLWLVVTGAPNMALRFFGESLAVWAADAVRFQSCMTEEKPFPWKPWPRAK